METLNKIRLPDAASAAREEAAREERPIRALLERAALRLQALERRSRTTAGREKWKFSLRTKPTDAASAAREEAAREDSQPEHSRASRIAATGAGKKVANDSRAREVLEILAQNKANAASAAREEAAREEGQSEHS